MKTANYISILLLICSQASAAPLYISTTIWPITNITREIGGTRVDVHPVMPPGADCDFWFPEDKIIVTIRKRSDLFIVNGAGFERWVDQTCLDEERLVRVSKALDGKLLVNHDKVVHRHGSKGLHSHAGPDPHFLTDPQSVQAVVKLITGALVQADPQGKDYFETRSKTLLLRLKSLCLKYARATRNARLKVFLTSHPAFGYLARSFGLRQIPFHLDPESEPAESEIKKIRSAAATHGIGCLVWESPPAPKTAALLKKRTGLDSLVMLTAETPSRGEISSYGSYLDVLERNLKVLTAALSGR